MMDYLAVKLLHIVASTLLFGTGIGSAFYLLTAVVSRQPAYVARITRWVVRADWIFTATTAVAQPITGAWMLRKAGWPLDAAWVTWSIALYVVAMACWIPVVWLQMRMRDLAGGADRASQPLPAAFWTCFRWWFALGVPALFAFLAIFWLMVAKPT